VIKSKVLSFQMAEYLANRKELKRKKKWLYLIFKPWVFEV